MVTRDQMVEAYQIIITTLRNIPDDELRRDVMDKVAEVFCRQCWMETNGLCHCMNDE